MVLESQTTLPTFAGRLGLIQRVLPSYRAPFFDLLAASSEKNLSVFAGQPQPGESIDSAEALNRAVFSKTRNIHFFSPSSSLYFCFQTGLTAWLDQWNPDALIVEANFRYLSSPAGIRWMTQRSRPVIGWGLGAPLDRGPISTFRNRFLSKFDALIAYSRRGADQYAACGFPADKIFVALNSVAAAPTWPLPVRSIPFSGQPVLLFVGRLQARKRLPALLEACAALPAELKPRLVIVGDGPEAESLKSLARRLYPAAEFVGARHGAELTEYFLSADLFVLPGTGGLAVQQAMSYGLPVIVAEGDGTQDDLVRPANGWQIPRDDQDALKEVLLEALQDVNRLRKMGEESYRITLQEINLEQMLKIFIRVLNQVSR